MVISKGSMYPHQESTCPHPKTVVDPGRACRGMRLAASSQLAPFVVGRRDSRRPRRVASGVLWRERTFGKGKCDLRRRLHHADVALHVYRLGRLHLPSGSAARRLGFARARLRRGQRVGREFISVFTSSNGVERRTCHLSLDSKNTPIDLFVSDSIVCIAGPDASWIILHG